MPDQLEKFLLTYEPRVSTLALKLRQVIKKNVRGIAEQLDIPARMIMYSLGPGYKGMVCTIIPSKKGVKLGFYRGADLPDPFQLLTGTGKVHRHVEIRSETDLVRVEIKNLLNAAERSCRGRLAAPK